MFWLHSGYAVVFHASIDRRYNLVFVSAENSQGPDAPNQTMKTKLSYNVDDFLKMDDQVKAFYGLRDAIIKEERKFSPAELRVLSMPDFLGLCCANGFDDLYWQARYNFHIELRQVYRMLMPFLSNHLFLYKLIKLY